MQTSTKTCRRKQEILLVYELRVDVHMLVLKMRNSVLYFMWSVQSVSEMQKLRCVIGDLQDKLSALEEANDTSVKERIVAQSCAEELRKRLKESTV
jgi:hypothetical protein